MVNWRRRETCLGCNHPAWGQRGEGHFQNGNGPCKHLGCLCASFVPDPDLQQRRRRGIVTDEMLAAA